MEVEIDVSSVHGTIPWNFHRPCPIVAEKFQLQSSQTLQPEVALEHTTAIFAGFGGVLCSCKSFAGFGAPINTQILGNLGSTSVAQPSVKDAPLDENIMPRLRACIVQNFRHPGWKPLSSSNGPQMGTCHIQSKNNGSDKHAIWHVVDGNSIVTHTGDATQSLLRVNLVLPGGGIEDISWMDIWKPHKRNENDHFKKQTSVGWGKVLVC